MRLKKKDEKKKKLDKETNKENKEVVDNKDDKIE